MFRISALIVVLLPALQFAIGCGGSGGSGNSGTLGPAITTREEAARPGKWTVLVYLDADNDLERAGIRNFNQMEMAGSTSDVRVIVQMDRKDANDSYNERWTDTRRYLILRDRDSRVMNSLRLDDVPLGECDMADPQTLRDFVEWGVREFPAEHYCLIIWDHGSGWEFSTRALMPQFKYVIIDETGPSREMNVTDIPDALQGLPLDLLAFDACYMQQLEVAYQLRNAADYIVGSAAAEPSPGYQYYRILSKMNAGATPRDLGRLLVECYAAEYPPPRKGITLSALETARLPEVAANLDALAGALTSTAGGDAAFIAARDRSLNYSTCTGDDERYSLDLLDYARRAAAAGAAVSAAYDNLMQSVRAAVVAETHNPDTPAASGTGIYLPPPLSFDTRYRMLDLARDTGWDEWIQDQPR